jgi:hypothetical protein
VLDSHRGLDYGALEVARAFGTRLGVVPFTATTTRLVVDLNRSSYHPNVFSEYTRVLTREQRVAAMARTIGRIATRSKAPSTAPLQPAALCCTSRLTASRRCCTATYATAT